jgi:hypothetical protein
LDHVTINSEFDNVVPPSLINAIVGTTGDGNDTVDVEGFQLWLQAPAGGFLDHYVNIVTGSGADQIVLSVTSQDLSDLTSSWAHLTIAEGGNTTVLAYDKADAATVGYSLSNVEISPSLQYASFDQISAGAGPAFNMRLFNVQAFDLGGGPNALLFDHGIESPGMTLNAWINGIDFH